MRPSQTVMTLVMSAIISWGKVTCLFLFTASILVMYVYCFDMPCYFDFSNTMIVVMYGLMMWGATMATALIYDPRVLPWLYTNIGFYGAGFIGLGCIAMCWGVQKASRRRALMFVVRVRARAMQVHRRRSNATQPPLAVVPGRSVSSARNIMPNFIRDLSLRAFIPPYLLFAEQIPLYGGSRQGAHSRFNR